MISFNYSGIKNTIASFTLFKFDFGKKPNIDTSKLEIVQTPEKIIDKPQPKDYKTTLGGTKISLIEKLNGDLTAYLFIEKNKILEHSAWNMVVPVIIESRTKIMYQYTNGGFALEGSGGGLSNTRSLLRYLKLHMDKGFNVLLIPKVIDNDLLDNFKFIDSGVDLDILIKNSTDLILYRKNEFEWIYSQYKELLSELNLEK